MTGLQLRSMLSLLKQAFQDTPELNSSKPSTKNLQASLIVDCPTLHSTSVSSLVEDTSFPNCEFYAIWCKKAKEPSPHLVLVLDLFNLVEVPLSPVPKLTAKPAEFINIEPLSKKELFK